MRYRIGDKVIVPSGRWGKIADVLVKDELDEPYYTIWIQGSDVLTGVRKEYYLESQLAPFTTISRLLYET